MQMEKYFCLITNICSPLKTKQPENSNHSSHPINTQPECLTMLYDNRDRNHEEEIPASSMTGRISKSDMGSNTSLHLHQPS